MGCTNSNPQPWKPSLQIISPVATAQSSTLFCRGCFWNSFQLLCSSSCSVPCLQSWLTMMQIQQQVLWNSSLGTRLMNPTPSLPSLSIPKVYRNRYDGRILRTVIYLVVWLCGFQFLFFIFYFGYLELGIGREIGNNRFSWYVDWLLLSVIAFGVSKWVFMGPSMALINCILQSTGNETVGFWIQFKWVCFFVFSFIYLFIYFWILVWNQGNLRHSVFLLHWWFWITLTTFFLW